MPAGASVCVGMTWLLASTTGKTWLQQTPQKSLGLAHYFDKLSNL